jgi:hypothetical protein
MKPEELYRSKIDKWLTIYFEIEREVWSTERRRIDYVLTCKTSSAMFGLEVKSDGQFRGREAGEYLKQAQDYTRQVWKCKKYTGKLPIFIAPAISNTYKEIRYETIRDEWGNALSAQTPTQKEYYEAKHFHKHEHSNMNSLIGTICNVGEVRKIVGYRGVDTVAFCFMNKIIWMACRKDKINLTNYKTYFNEI